MPFTAPKQDIELEVMPAAQPAGFVAPKTDIARDLTEADDYDPISHGSEANASGNYEAYDTAFEAFKQRYKNPKPFDVGKAVTATGHAFTSIWDSLKGAGKMAANVKTLAGDYATDFFNIGRFYLGGDRQKALSEFARNEKEEQAAASELLTSTTNAAKGLFVDLPYAVGRNALDIKNWISGDSLSDDELRERFDRMTTLRATSDEISRTGGIEGVTAGPEQRAQEALPITGNETPEQQQTLQEGQQQIAAEINQETGEQTAAANFAMLPMPLVNNPVTRGASGAALRVAGAAVEKSAKLVSPATTAGGLYGIFSATPEAMAASIAGSFIKPAVKGGLEKTGKLLTEAGDAMFTGAPIKGGFVRRTAGTAAQQMATGGVIGTAFALGSESPEEVAGSIIGGVASGPVFLFDRIPAGKTRGQVKAGERREARADALNEERYGAMRQFGEAFERSNPQHAQGMASIHPEEAKRINFMQGFLAGRKNAAGGQVEVQVLPSDAYAERQKYMKGGTGYTRGFVGSDGNIYLNAGGAGDVGGIGRAARHELGHVAERLAEIIGQDFAGELTRSIASKLYTSDGAAIPEFQAFIKKYQGILDRSVDMRAAESEFIAETVNKLLEGKSIEKWATKAGLGEQIRTGASDMMKRLGLAPRAKDGIFDWNEIPGITGRMRDILYAAGKGAVERSKQGLEEIQSAEKPEAATPAEEVIPPQEPPAAPVEAAPGAGAESSAGERYVNSEVAKGIGKSRLSESALKKRQAELATEWQEMNSAYKAHLAEEGIVAPEDTSGYYQEVLAFALGKKPSRAKAEAPAQKRDVQSLLDKRNQLVIQELGKYPHNSRGRADVERRIAELDAQIKAAQQPEVVLTTDSEGRLINKPAEPADAAPESPAIEPEGVLADFTNETDSTTASDQQRGGKALAEMPPLVVSEEAGALVPATDQIEQARANYPEGPIREAIDAIDANRGKVVWIKDYNAATKTQEGFNEAERTGEIRAQNAAKRKAGEEGTAQDKPFIPMEVRVNKKGEPYINGFDVDVMFSNLRHVVDFMREKGIENPLGDDAAINAALEAYNWNHAHGFDGAGLKPLKQPGPDYLLPKADQDAAPRPLDADPVKARRIADMLNMAVNSKPRELGVGEGSKAIALNVENAGFLKGSEVNQLRGELEKAGFDTDAQLSKRSAFYGRLAADLIKGGVATSAEGIEGKSVRPHGFDVDLGKAFQHGKPQFEAVAAGFMPGEGQGRKSGDLSDFGDESPSSIKSKSGKPLAQFMPGDASNVTDYYRKRSEDQRFGSGFYSVLERTIEDKLPNKFKAEQGWNTIKNAPGIKADELEFTDVEKWLKSQTGTVTKEDLLKYVRENNVQVSTEDQDAAPKWEVRSDNGTEDTYDTEREAERAAEKLNDEAQEEYIRQYGHTVSSETVWKVNDADGNEDASFDNEREAERYIDRNSDEENPLTLEEAETWIVYDGDGSELKRFDDESDAEEFRERKDERLMNNFDSPYYFSENEDGGGNKYGPGGEHGDSYYTHGGENYREVRHVAEGKGKESTKYVVRLKSEPEPAVAAQWKDMLRRESEINRRTSELDQPEEAAKRATNPELLEERNRLSQEYSDLQRQMSEFRLGNKELEPRTIDYVTKNTREEAETALADVQGRNPGQKFVIEPLTKREPAKNYKESHWDEPNVVAHSREQDFEATDGASVRLIDEVQSDWIQQARDERKEAVQRLARQRNITEEEASKQLPANYAFESTPQFHVVSRAFETKGPFETKAEAEAELNHVLEGPLYTSDPAEWKVFTDDQDNLEVVMDRDMNAPYYQNRPMVVKDASGEVIHRVRAAGRDEALQDAKDRRATGNRAEIKELKKDSLPDAPFKNTWMEMTFKKSLMQAVRDGMDRIGWTQGIEHVKRYEAGFRKAVDAIEWTKQGDKVAVVAKKGDNAVFNEEIPLEGKAVIQGKRASLADVVGKKMAKDIREAQEREGKIEGDDLSIGGEGMKGPYDEQLPNKVNDIIGRLLGKKGRYVKQTFIADADAGTVHRKYFDLEPVQSVSPDFPSFEEFLRRRGIPQEEFDAGKPSEQEAVRQSYEDQKQAQSEYEETNSSRYWYFKGKDGNVITQGGSAKTFPTKEAAQEWIIKQRDNSGKKIWSVDITPEIKKKVQEEGLPIFMPGEKPGEGKPLESFSEEASSSIKSKKALGGFGNEDLEATAAQHGSTYQGLASGLHAFKELSTGGNFSIKEGEVTPELIQSKSEEVRKSFEGKPEVTEDNLDDFLRSQGINFMPGAGKQLEGFGDDLGFYSALEKAVTDKIPNRASVEQIKATLDPSKSGVKKEEMEWLGLDEFLKDKKTVTKQELLDFIKANNVELKEVTKREGRSPEEEKEFEAEVQRVAQEIHDKRVDDEIELMIERGADEDDIDRTDVSNALDWHQSEIQATNKLSRERPDDTTKFAQYTLPGGKNYKEILWTLPQTKERFTKAFKEKHDIRLTTKEEKARGVPAKYVASIKGEPDYRVAGGETEQEVIDGAFERATSGALALDPSAFKSNHWDETNVVAHVRQADHTDTEGASVRLIEEIQSDWHQKGREQGYFKDEALPDTSEWKVESRSGRSVMIRTPDGIITRIENEDRPDAAVIASAAANMAASNRAGRGVPNAPFKKTWHEVAFKRALRQAVEDGVDKIAWTPGEQQAERYNLSKQVKAIRIENIDGDAKKLSIYVTPKDGGYESKVAEGIPLEKLSDHVGKEIAQKFQDGLKDKPETQTFEGLDLKVGGEGMKGFYDKILPDFVRKYVKKWGGKVETTELPGEYDASGNQPFTERTRAVQVLDAGGEIYAVFKGHNEELVKDYNHLLELEQEYGGSFAKSYVLGDKQPAVKVHSVTITPEMRAAVKGGQPLFMPGKKPLDGFSEDSSSIKSKEEKSLAQFMPSDYSGRGEFDVSEKKERLKEDLTKQRDFLSERAALAGFKSASEMATESPEDFAELGREWREKNPRFDKEGNQLFMPGKEELDKELAEVAARHADNLEASAYSSIVGSKKSPAIHLDTLLVKKIARSGAGTAYMEDLLALADKYDLPIVLKSAEKGYMRGDDEFKATSSFKRLQDFYKKFGFRSNYGKRNYRADLPGNMNRPPASGASFMPGVDHAAIAGVADPKDKKAARKAWITQKTESPWFKKWFGDSKVVDDKGNPLEVYSGHGNAQLYGDEYNPKKGVAGGFYATEAPDIASNYSEGKLGGANRHDETPGSHYLFKQKNGKYGKKLWQLDRLTPEQVEKVREFFADEENGLGTSPEEYWENNKNYDRDSRLALIRGGLSNLVNIHQFMDSMGYTIAYDKQESQTGSRLRADNQSKNSFDELLDKLGLQYDSHDWYRPGVMKLYLKITKPIDADEPFPKDLLAALKKKASRERAVRREDSLLSSQWTSELPLKEWVASIEDEDSYWTTQVPAKALPIIKQFGYDGIKERGLKGETDRSKRQINWIAFDPEQIKSATGNRGTFDPSESSMLRMPGDNKAMPDTRRTWFVKDGKRVYHQRRPDGQFAPKKQTLANIAPAGNDDSREEESQLATFQ